MFEDKSKITTPVLIAACFMDACLLDGPLLDVCFYYTYTLNS
jgi:hypothetical protein